LAALILKFAPAPGAEITIFFAVSLLAGIVGKYFPWRKSLNNLAVVFLSVFAFYALAGIQFILLPFFWKELFLNLAFGWIIFYFLSLCGKMEK
jgi:CHASE2 domain-containing sensor protein